MMQIALMCQDGIEIEAQKEEGRIVHVVGKKNTHNGVEGIIFCVNERQYERWAVN